MFLTCRALFPAMKAQKRGKIVNIISSRVWERTPNRLHYTTSKAGLIGFTRALAREVPANIEGHIAPFSSDEAAAAKQMLNILPFSVLDTSSLNRRSPNKGIKQKAKAGSGHLPL
jgi:NAD(P)-dependent dehydrogenase (short-subunit alcohol dehydrogenase family)